MDPTLYLAYVVACAAIVVVPGPTVTVIIANSLRYGTRAGLLNVAGTQAGLAIMLVVLALGLETIVRQMGEIFFWVKLAGAGYLVWLGIKLWRSGGAIIDPEAVATRRTNFFLQGFLVILSNPKALFFFGAFIPQFIDASRGSAAVQAMVLAATFMVVATVLDGAYAVLAGSTGRLFTRERVKLVERISGTCLIGGGIWLALARRPA
ncbi:MAG: LysE family translocator [Rhodobiaceae bacterium]|nr:LysE family translocator [Rhodobiaceae bacterium]MCC0041567.1 LysE family translocator [Rhodobiaceae bacterium]MCC0052806.1 LysE family translocator [Rhodobiaceae bacterium]